MEAFGPSSLAWLVVRLHELQQMEYLGCVTSKTSEDENKFALVVKPIAPISSTDGIEDVSAMGEASVRGT